MNLHHYTGINTVKIMRVTTLWPVVVSTDMQTLALTTSTILRNVKEIECTRVPLTRLSLSSRDVKEFGINWEWLWYHQGPHKLIRCTWWRIRSKAITLTLFFFAGHHQFTCRRHTISKSMSCCPLIAWFHLSGTNGSFYQRSVHRWFWNLFDLNQRYKSDNHCGVCYLSATVCCVVQVLT